LRTILALGCSVAAIGTVAMAAEAEADNDVVAEVVVTAQFREQKLQDTPLAITALNAEAMAARGLTDVSSITNTAPNVTLKPLGAAFGPALGASIRGIGQFDFNPALEPGVGVYVDDVYFPTLTGSDMDLLDLDRIEVLRGPQGTLTGRNSIGGAIRLVSKQPGTQNGGFVEAAYGSRDRIDVRGAADLVINDKLSLRISGTHKSQDGYVKQINYGCAFPASGVPAQAASRDCVLGRDGDVNYSGVRASLRFDPTEQLSVVLTGDYTRSKTRPPGEVLTFASLPLAGAPNTGTTNGLALSSAFICGRYCNYRQVGQPARAWTPFAPVPPFSLFAGYPLSATSGPDEQSFTGKGVSANVRFELSDDFNIQSITAYREYESEFGADADLAPTNVQYGLNRLDHRFFSQELRLNGQVGEQIRFTVGGYYSDQKTTYFTLQDIRYAPFPLQFVGDDPVPTKSKALFATVFWTPMEALNVTAGLRYTKETKDYTFVRTNIDGSANPILGSLNGVTGHYSGDRVDYRISVDYRWNSALMTYATISTGFKGGGVNPRPFTAPQVQPFGQERLQAYELGAKSDLLEGRLRLNAAVFYNKYKDIQLTLLSCPQFGGPGPCALPANVGDANVKGAELELTATPVDGLSLNAAVSYLDFDYTRLAAATGLSKSFSPPYAPEWKASFGAQYEIDLGGAGSLTPRVDVSYQDAVFTNAANSARNRIPSYTLVNANLTWRNTEGDLSATLEVTNLTDKYYDLTKFDLTGAGAGVVVAHPGRPREFAVRLKKTF
jgi:iron complex outermembrane receptor protein